MNRFVTQDSNVKKRPLFALCFVCMFFLPYIYSTNFRPDNLLLGIALLFFPLILFFEKQRVTLYYLILSMIPLSYIVILFVVDFASFDGMWFLKIIGQYSMICSSCVCFVFLRHVGVTKLDFYRAVIIVALVVVLYSFFQYYFRDSGLVHSLYSLYGRERTFVNFHRDVTMAEYAIMNNRTSSILISPTALGAYCILIIGFCFSTLPSPFNKKITILTMLSSLFAGFLSATKFFIGGIIIFFVIKEFCALTKKVAFRIVAIGSLLFVGTKFVNMSYFAELIKGIGEIGFVGTFFGSRFNQTSYLYETIRELCTIDSMLFGVGINSVQHSVEYADSMILMLISLGGLPLLILFYLPVLFLIYSILQADMLRSEKVPLFSLHMVFLLSSVAFPIYIQNRIVPIFVICSLYMIIPPATKFKMNG